MGCRVVNDVCDSGFPADLTTHNGRWYAGAQEPPITTEQWAAYQQRREAQRIIPTKARSPKWSLAGIAVCGSRGGPMYCTSSPRGHQYALYCGAARVSGACKGSYRTRAAVEAAIGLWLQQYANALMRATHQALGERPRLAPDPGAHERRRLAKLVERSTAKLDRLLDAHVDGAVDLAEYRRRRDVLRQDVDQAQARLRDLNAPQPAEPKPVVVAGFADLWPILSVEARRDVAAALLKSVRTHPDKTVELLPHWEAPVHLAFSTRNSIPHVGHPPG